MTTIAREHGDLRKVHLLCNQAESRFSRSVLSCTWTGFRSAYRCSAAATFMMHFIGKGNHFGPSGPRSPVSPADRRVVVIVNETFDATIVKLQTNVFSTEIWLLFYKSLRNYTIKNDKFEYNKISCNFSILRQSDELKVNHSQFEPNTERAESPRRGGRTCCWSSPLINEDAGRDAERSML